PIYSVFVRKANGVAQAVDGEPERFWPRGGGALTRQSLLEIDSDRAVSELADYADRLLMVQGCNHPFPVQLCGHGDGGAQCLTAAQFVGFQGNTVKAQGPSIDTRIAEALSPGVEPLTLMSGRSDDFIGAMLSYHGPMMRRAAETNPFNVFLDLFFDGAPSPEAMVQLAMRRSSVNDFVRDEMQQLLRRDLGSHDRQRLEFHFDAIRDMEVLMACAGLADEHVAQLDSVKDRHEANDSLELVTQLHARLIALAFACNLRRTATLQIGSGQDGTLFVVDGVLYPSWHHISHRKATDDVFEEAPAIESASLMHHQIDRIHGRLFRFLLDRLDEQQTIAGYNLLNDSVALWTSDVATGPDHGYDNLPHIIAGSAGGFLRQGVMVDAGGVTNNKFLSTLVSATGVRTEAGELVEDFGDPGLEPGVISEMIA
ncbi:MAG: DUF1552 domain-containing protein, partial [Myxococcota bacterium]|nr:DUF1552 domain-containing protein [Myxococcota bacterium]